MTPYDRLKRIQQQPQMAPPLPQAQPMPTGMPLQFISGVGDDAGGDDGQGFSDIGAALGQYLKGRQAQARVPQQGTAVKGGLGGLRIAPGMRLFGSGHF